MSAADVTPERFAELRLLEKHLCASGQMVGACLRESLAALESAWAERDRLRAELAARPDTVEVTRKAWGVAERLFEWVETGRVSPNEEGYCMCGASRGGCENDHGYTDMAIYYWDALRKDVDALRAKAQPATERERA